MTCVVSCLFVVDVMQTFMLVINNLKSSWYVLSCKAEGIHLTLLSTGCYGAHLLYGNGLPLTLVISQQTFLLILKPSSALAETSLEK